MGTAEAAETFAGSESWVQRIKQRFRDAGETAPRRPAHRGPAPILADQADRIRQEVQDHPGRTKVLVPELRPGDVVVLANLGSHGVAGVRAAVEGAGCRLLDLPPYSPT